MDTGQEEQQEVSDPAVSIDADYVATSDDAQPDGTLKGSYEPN